MEKKGFAWLFLLKSLKFINLNSQHYLTCNFRNITIHKKSIRNTWYIYKKNRIKIRSNISKIRFSRIKEHVGQIRNANSINWSFLKTFRWSSVGGGSVVQCMRLQVSIPASVSPVPLTENQLLSQIVGLIQLVLTVARFAYCKQLVIDNWISDTRLL